MANLLMVPLIMGCALVGTVGMIKAINKVSPKSFDETKNKEKRKENK